MPELPEVEHAANRLRQAVLGHTIGEVRTFHATLGRHLPAAARKRLAGRRIERIERRAKIQLLHLDDGSVLEVHFRMTGDWEFTAPQDPVPRFERVRIGTREGVRVSFVDSRALGVIRWHAPGKLELPALGPEPLTDDFSVDALQQALARRKAPIKPVLLDQKVVSGVGNIYASEALWVAKISPTSVASTLRAARLTRLRDAIRDVLRAAGDARYYGGGVADAGENDVEWRVYDREGLPCLRCGSAIRRIGQGGRSTYYCARCQR